MFYVYILKSIKDQRLYIGSSNNLKKRIIEHNKGKVFSTKYRLPLELRYYEAYSHEREARKREKSLTLRGKSLVELRKRIVDSLA